MLVKADKNDEEKKVQTGYIPNFIRDTPAEIHLSRVS